MANLIELRCVCTNPAGRHPKLGEASGTDFTIKVKCPHCKQTVSFTYPHPLGVKVTPQK